MSMLINENKNIIFVLKNNKLIEADQNKILT